MGYDLAKQTSVIRPLRLTPRARLIAMVMAVHAHDETGLYWAGHGILAIALGFQEDDPSGLRAVRRCIAELLEEQVIEHAKTGRPGRNAEYRFP